MCRLFRGKLIVEMSMNTDNKNCRLVVGLGEVLWDCLPSGRKLGGAPANFTYHAMQCGCNAVAVSAVGNDALGEETLDLLASKGLRCEMPAIDYPTGKVEVTLDADGVPAYRFSPDVAWDHIPFSAAVREIAKTCRAVCFGSLAQRSNESRDAISKFLDATPADCLKIFDINLRQNFYDFATLEHSMNRCNVLKINDEEFELVTRLAGLKLEDVETAARALMKRYAISTLVLTCGEEGSYVFADDGTANHEKTPRVCVADTVGAGDSFTAAFVSGMLGGMGIAAAHKLAVDVSAFVCTQHGAMPELPAELARRFKEAND